MTWHRCVSLRATGWSRGSISPNLPDLLLKPRLGPAGLPADGREIAFIHRLDQPLPYNSGTLSVSVINTMWDLLAMVGLTQPTDLVLRDPLLLQALGPSGAWEVGYRRAPDAYGLETFGHLFV
jgi:hypothetical protein